MAEEASVSAGEGVSQRWRVMFSAMTGRGDVRKRDMPALDARDHDYLHHHSHLLPPTHPSQTKDSNTQLSNTTRIKSYGQPYLANKPLIACQRTRPSSAIDNPRRRPHESFRHERRTTLKVLNTPRRKRSFTTRTTHLYSAVTTASR